MTLSDILAAIGIAMPVISGILGYTIRNKNEEIKLLKTKNDAKDDLIQELKLQNAKMEITGTLVNRFFSQLPPANNEISKKEIKP